MSRSTSAPTQVMQGIEVPTSSINAAEFFRRTRRLTFSQKTFQYSGLGFTDNVPVLQTGIISGLTVKFSGSLTVALPTGTVQTTPRWPYDLMKAGRVSANGMSNLQNVSGWKYKAREIMARGDLTDRGVPQFIGGAYPGTARTQGTLSLNNESWGVGQNVTAIAAGTYSVELEWYIPIAFDDSNSLLGAIFAQTSATDLNLALDWAPPTDLFITTGTATVALTGSCVVSGKAYTIPQAPNGSVVVPDLSTFHSMIQTRSASPVNGVNEIRLAGQGVGKQLMRLFWQTWNTTGGISAPLPVNATNTAQVGWRFGSNDTPEMYNDGRLLAYAVEKTFDCDLCTFQGIKVLDWCSENAFRDSIDEGTATELRFIDEIPSAIVLSGAYIEYVQESLSVGAAA